ncbi:atlastin-1-like [Paramacrobiotus metropolitanus]|uniref:atlastin-1-like n=1 Tax=Paramacrobiotus metropolitanus TaxID=2943436 RepID=UPI0024460A6E|nr:atlastin-1-like [Paramacrobiotus metropolitanus]
MARRVWALAVKRNDDLYLHQMKDFIQRLQQDDIKDLPICLVGVVGKYREGKSTMLNIMHRYLLECEKGSNVRIEDYLYQKAGQVDIFETSPDVKGCTQGIWITSDPYIIHNSTNGNCAVFLLDTQGLYDTMNKDSLDSALFLLTSMITSVTIYNVMRNIGRENLDTLAQFSRLASQIRSQFYSGQEKVFQDLIILTRDALTGNEEHGWRDGRQMVQIEDPEMRNKDTIREIQQAFRNLRGFWMPRIASEPDEKSFRLTSESILPKFKHYVAVFLDEVFGRMLTVFEHRRIEYQCAGYADFLMHIASLFEDGKIPRAESMLDAMVRLEFQVAMETAFAHYRKHMYQAVQIDQLISLDDLKRHHTHFKAECRLIPEAVVLNKQTERSRTFVQKLDLMLEEEFSLITGNHQARLRDEEKHQAELRKKDAAVIDLKQSMLEKDASHMAAMDDINDRMANMAKENEEGRRKLQAEKEAREVEHQRVQAENRRQYEEAQCELKQLRCDMEKAKECQATTWQQFIPEIIGAASAAFGQVMKTWRKTSQANAAEAQTNAFIRQLSTPSPATVHTAAPSSRAPRAPSSATRSERNC